MSFIDEKTFAPASVFALSPPSSAGAGASDCELDPHRHETDQREQDGITQHARRKPRTDSSPLSLSPASHSAPSTISSFAASDHKQGKGTVDGRQQASHSRGRRRKDSSDLDRAVSIIKTLWKGEVPSLQYPEWHVLRIPASQYTQLCRRLEDEDKRLLSFFESDIRADYDPKHGVLVLRLMETALHAGFRSIFVRHLWIQLYLCSSSPDRTVSDLASKILPFGTGKVTLELEPEPEPEAEGEGEGEGQDQHGGANTLGYKHPDSQSRFRGTASPQFVLEVGYSQKALALEQLAREYFEKGSEIKTVLTIKIPYKDPKQRSNSGSSRRAAFCLYRGPERIHDDVAFRDDEGSPTDGGSLRLLLSDFIPDDVLESLNPECRRQVDGAVIDITSQQLCQFLEDAEASQRADDQRHQELKQRQLGQLSRKRKTVQWAPSAASQDRDDDTHHGDASGDSDASGGGDRAQSIGSRSKRQKTGSDSNFRPSRPHRQQIGSTETRQTRSRSRSEAGLQNLQLGEGSS